MIDNFSNKKLARIAGLLYLIVVLTGIFSLAYIPSKLIVWDNPTSTFHNIVSSESLFRLGILGVLLMLGCFGYLINFVGLILIPNYAKLGISSLISLPASIGEIGTCL